MSISPQDIADIINQSGMTLPQFAALITRSTLLTEIASLDSQIANARAKADQAQRDMQEQITALQDQRDAVQAKLNVLA